MHEKGVIHRDIKPQNMMIDENENLKSDLFALTEMRDRERDRNNRDRDERDRKDRDREREAWQNDDCNGTPNRDGDDASRAPSPRATWAGTSAARSRSTWAGRPCGRRWGATSSSRAATRGSAKAVRGGCAAVPRP